MTLVNSPRDVTRSFEIMNTFNYYVPKDGSPNPRGPLSSAINLQAISSANRAAEAALVILQKLTAEKSARSIQYILCYTGRNYSIQTKIQG